MADALDLGSSAARCRGSSPLLRTRIENRLPKVFTEKGLYMLAIIHKSPRATQTTIAIIEAFAKMRELSRAINLLS